MRAWQQCVTRARICALVIIALTIASVCPPGLLAATASVDLSGVRRYRTSSGENLATLTPISVSGGSFTTSLPGQSITSFVSP